jgi:hypothetical protein
MHTASAEMQIWLKPWPLPAFCFKQAQRDGCKQNCDLCFSQANKQPSSPRRMGGKGAKPVSVDGAGTSTSGQKHGREKVSFAVLERAWYCLSKLSLVQHENLMKHTAEFHLILSRLWSRES